MIRNATCADAASLAELFNGYVLGSMATFEETPISPQAMAQRIETVQNKALPWLVSETDGVVDGFAYAKPFNPRSAYRYTAEVSVYVARSRASKGVGSELYAALFLALKAASIRRVIGIVTLPNDKSVALHEKFGMKKVAHLEQVGYKFDSWVDVGYWQGSLDD